MEMLRRCYYEMENEKEERRKECRIQWPSPACQLHTLLLALFVFRAFCFEQFCIFSGDVESLAKTPKGDFVIANDKILGRNRRGSLFFYGAIWSAISGISIAILWQ